MNIKDLIAQAVLLLVLLVTTFLITLTDIFANSESANFMLTSECFESPNDDLTSKSGAVNNSAMLKMEIFGCTDPDANNYNPDADTDDGSCTYDPCMLDLNIEFDCDTMRSFVTGNYPTQGAIWSVNNEVLPGPEWQSWIPSTNTAYLWYELTELGTYEVCAENPHPACETPVCSTVVIDDSCLEGCPSSAPSSSMSDCIFSIQLDNFNEDVQFVTVEVEGFEGTYTPFSYPQLGLVDWYATGSTIDFLFDDPGTHEICISLSNTTCTKQWYCYEVEVGECTDEIVMGCTDPNAANYNPEANFNNSVCQYDFCSVSFEAAPSDDNPEMLVITPSAEYVDALGITWYFGDGNVSNEIFPTHDYDGDGPFNLCLYASFNNPTGANCYTNYCMEIDASMLGRSSGFAIQVVPPTTLNTSEATTAESLQLWPNPASSEVQVSFTSAGNKAARLHIYDMNGRAVYAENWPLASGEQQIAINTAGFSSGVYLVQLVQGDMMESKRMVVGK